MIGGKAEAGAAGGGEERERESVTKREAKYCYCRVERRLSLANEAEDVFAFVPSPLTKLNQNNKSSISCSFSRTWSE